MKENKKVRRESGITLIALVITIVVLLILAAVTIATLTGENGILTQATKSAAETERAAEEEAIRLAVTSLNAEKYSNPDKFPNGLFTAEQLNEEVSKSKAPDEVTGSGTLTVTYNKDKDDERNYIVTQDGVFYDKDVIEGNPDTTDVITGQDGEWQYVMLSNGEIQLTKYLGSSNNLVVPANYDGHTVAAVGGIDYWINGLAKNILGDALSFSESTGNTRITSITIEEGIKSIKTSAFMSFKGVTNLTLPNSLAYIGAYAFTDMQNLQGELKLPNNLYYIGYQSFAYNKKLTGDLIIPDSVTTLEAVAFGYTGFNGNLKLSSNLKEIPDSAFYECSGLTGDLIIPEGVEKIGGRAFSHAGFDGELVLPSTLKEIGNNAIHLWETEPTFNGILEIPEGVEKIGAGIFAHCYRATNTTITIPRSVKEMGGNEENTIILATSFRIGNTIEKYARLSHMFYNCAPNTLKEFIVEEGNENYKAVDGVLYNMEGTQFIAYPNAKEGQSYAILEGVTEMGQLSFSRARNLRKLILPDSLEIKEVEDIYDSGVNYNNGNNLSTAIYRYTSINEIAVKSTNTRYKTVDGCLYSKDGKTLWYIPTDKTGTVNIEEGTTTIKDGAFTYGDTNLYSVHIPSSVTEISEQSIESLNAMINKVTIDSGCSYTISNGKVVKK